MNVRSERNLPELLIEQYGHPATLSWLGSVAEHRPYPLGVSTFGESGDVNSLYRKHAIDAEAILDMAALACLDASR